MALAGVEVQFDALALDAVKERLHKLAAHHVATEVEAQRVDTLVQDVESLGVGGFGVAVHVDVLAHIPCVVVLLVAANERKFTRQSVGSLQFLHVFAAIERGNIEALVGSPYQFLVEVSSLQVHLNLVKPFLSGRSCKLGKEFLFVV